MARFKKIGSMILACGIFAQGLTLFSSAADMGYMLSRYSIPAEFSQILHDSASGLGSNSVNDIAFDDKGFIWLGTDSGVYRYNSETFEKIEFADDTYADCEVDSVEFSDGIWAGTAENGLFCVKNSKLEKFDTQGYLSESITDLDAGANSNLVVASSGGIAVVHTQALSVYELSAELTAADKSVADVSCAADGLIWCVTSSGSVYFIADDVKADLDINGTEGSSFVTSQTPISVYACDTGRVFVGTQSGEIVFFDPCDDGSFDSGVIYCGGINAVNGFSQDDSGRVWFCSDNGIGYIYDKSAFLVESKLSESVNCAVTDFEGNVWFGSELEGALKLAVADFVNISSSTSLYGKLTNAVAVYNNLLYIGTDDGLFIYDALNGGVMVETELTQLLRGTKINCLLTDENGCLLIGTDEKYGLIKYNASGDGSWSVFNLSTGLLSERIMAIALLDDGSICVGNERGVSVISPNAEISEYLLDGGANSLSIGIENNIYAGTPNGAFLLQSGNVTVVSEDFGNMPVDDIYYDEATSAIVMSSQNSLYIAKDGDLFDVSTSLPENTSVYDAVTGADSSIILICADEIYTTTVADLEKNKQCMIYCGIHGLEAAATPNSQGCLVNNVLYICTVDGVVGVNKRESEYATQICINSALCDGKPVSFKDKISLDAKTKTLEIDVSVLSYLGDNKITYKLKGFDETERTVDSDENIYYTNLDGGKYTLVIYGTNARGEISAIKQIEIKKANLWYESVIFWVIIIIAVAIISFLVSMYFIVEKMRSEENHYSRQSNLSTQAISAVAEMIDSKSNVDSGHSMRVALYSVEIAKRLKCSEEFVDELYCAALLHDIGNIGISDEIMKKPHKLTPEELKTVQTHVEKGADILKHHDALRDLSDAVLHHHERFDGMGYGKKLAGDAIPLASRIIFASESLDAMQTEKPYRPKLARERIIGEFKVGSGTQFDPDIAEIVIKMVESGYKPEA